MPAVSGSPTQVSTSVLTPQELSGVPDSSLLAGDLAWVDSLKQHFVLRRDAAPYTANNTTVISTLSGNGYWLAMENSSVWETAANWYVNAMTGSDSASGITLSAPIKTLGELWRRISGATSPIVTTIHLLSDIPDTDPLTLQDLIQGSVVTVEGHTYNIVSTGTGTIDPGAGVFGYLGGASMAANDHFELVTDVAAADLVGKAIRLTSGAQVGAICYGVYAVGANRIRTTRFMQLDNTPTSPSNGDTFEYFDPHELQAKPRISNPLESYVVFECVTINDVGSITVGEAFNGFFETRACYLTGGALVIGSGVFYTYGTLIDCEIYVTRFGQFSGQFGAMSDGSRIEAIDGGFVSLTEQMLMQGDVSVTLDRSSYLETQNLGVFDVTTSALVCEGLCDFKLRGYLYGENNDANNTGNVHVLEIGSGVRGLYDSEASLVVAMRLANQPLLFRGYAATTLNPGLPIIHTALATDTQSYLVLAT